MLTLVVDDTESCFDFIKRTVEENALKDIQFLPLVKSAALARDTLERHPNIQLVFVDLSLMADSSTPLLRSTNRADSGVLLIKELISKNTGGKPKHAIVAITFHDEASLLSEVDALGPHAFWHKNDEGELNSAILHARFALNNARKRFQSKTIKDVLAIYHEALNQIDKRPKTSLRLKHILKCVADGKTTASQIEPILKKHLGAKTIEIRTIQDDLIVLRETASTLNDKAIESNADLMDWAIRVGFRPPKYI
jgi:DNA-binding NarL/FixJ family response regulator